MPSPGLTIVLLVAAAVALRLLLRTGGRLLKVMALVAALLAVYWMASG